jgi:bifunctional DNA-binding transcriptional regulator/antitoxin component of YhaV-PrlF toxin-antitoxin module
MTKSNTLLVINGTVSKSNQVYLPAEIAEAVSVDTPNLSREYTKAYCHDNGGELVLAGDRLDRASLSHIADKPITVRDDDAETISGRITLPSPWRCDSRIGYDESKRNDIIIELIDLDGTSVARIQSIEYYIQRSSPSI